MNPRMSAASCAIARSLIALIVLSVPMFAQQRKPVAIIVQTPENDADCPAFESALRDVFAASPRYEPVDTVRVGEGRAMLLTVSCLSLHDAKVLTVYYTIQAFDDNAKAKSDPLFSTQSTGQLLHINTSPKEFANAVLVSFDQSVKKHYEK